MIAIPIFVTMSKSEKLTKLIMSDPKKSPRAPEYIKIRLKKTLNPAGKKSQLTLLVTSNC
jgi:hypothetical protein